MASSKETYCLCGQPYNIGQFMIECDCCREWFHGSCVDVKIFQSDDIDKYHCPKCCQTYGPSVLKLPTNNHRSDKYEIGSETRPAQVGTPAWVRALAARPLRPSPEALTRMHGHQFTEELVRDGGFTKPVLFSSPEGLEMKTPNPATFTVRSVLRYCGAQLEVEVIDVRKQSSLRMPLGDFVDYFETPPERREDKVLNVLSLEFSDTNMSALVDPPHVVRQLDWAERVWAAEPPRPAVQKYCLMSSGGSYTDWHLDFGGTCVWYHVLHGCKVFYLAPPTSVNLSLYQQWSSAHNQNEKFFGDMLEWYGTAELEAGQTLFIPGGWIHAVYTPGDSLVFGGNYLHSHQVPCQLKVYEIERRAETPLHYRYPLFEAMHWFAGAHLLAALRRHNEESQDEDFTLEAGPLLAAPAQMSASLLENIKVLANALKEWHALKSTDAAKRDNVPSCLSSGQLVRELARELRLADKRAARGKDIKVKSAASPTKTANKKQSSHKKSLKLTLPKPIMHMAHNGGGEYIEEKIPKENTNIIYAEEPYIETKEVIYPESRYIAQDVKYMTNLQEAKTYVLDGKELVMPDKGYVYQTYEELPAEFIDEHNGYVERIDKKNGASVLRIKSNASPSSSRAPPPYPHSILKSQLTARARPHTWTIKKDGGYEEHTLFTNETLHGASYGPGMYSADDIQQDYQYPAKTYQEYQPEEFQRYQLVPPAPATIQAQPAGPYPALPVPPAPAGGYDELPSYDAAVAAHYATNTVTEYVLEPPAPLQAAPAPAPVPAPAPAPASAAPPPRRSERPVRRRVSASYDYEDKDLYIDEAPAPRRRRRAPPRPAVRPTAGGLPAPAAYLAPANGIESLIQASVLAEVEAEEPPSATSDAAAAVAGMLSISAAPYSPPARTFGLAARPAPADPEPVTKGSSRRSGRATAGASSADEDYADEEDVIKEVHRDDEYVYPALDPTSSDEDEEWAAARRRRGPRRADARAKTDKDGAWSPRGRLGRLVPRARGAARAHVRRECVRAALTAAAARQPNAKKAVIATKSKRPPPPAPATSPKNNSSNSRLKKGMKTAKQRLGKILKLHKMMI